MSRCENSSSYGNIKSVSLWLESIQNAFGGQNGSNNDHYNTQEGCAMKKNT